MNFIQRNKLMTQEEYEKLCLLINRKKTLENIKKKLSEDKYSLGYIYNPECILFVRYAESFTISLRDLLDKHDNMIREEINQEIERLEKEIQDL